VPPPAARSRPVALPAFPAGPFYQDYYKDDKEGRIALLNCLAAYNTTIAARSKNKQVPVLASNPRCCTDLTPGGETWCPGVHAAVLSSRPARDTLAGQGTISIACC
jgi:hypothetical protein